jgi:hypothetical protein
MADVCVDFKNVLRLSPIARIEARSDPSNCDTVPRQPRINEISAGLKKAGAGRFDRVSRFAAVFPSMPNRAEGPLHRSQSPHPIETACSRDGS